MRQLHNYKIKEHIFFNYCLNILEYSSLQYVGE